DDHAKFGLYTPQGKKISANHIYRPLEQSEILVKKEGEILKITAGKGQIELPVSQDVRYALADMLLERLQLYHGIYKGQLGTVSLTPLQKKEFTMKVAALEQVIALHKHRPRVTAFVLIGVSKAYLQLIQEQTKFRVWKKFSTPKKGDPRISPAVDIDPGCRAIIFTDREQYWFKKGIQEADFLRNNYMIDSFGMVTVTSILQPVKVVFELPVNIVTAPLYGGYTLASGRNMEGEYASTMEKVFAGVDVALVFTPASLAILKRLHPKVYNRIRALASLDRFLGRKPKGPGLLPWKKFKDPRVSLEIAKKQTTVQRSLVGITNAEKAIAELPGKISKAKGALSKAETALQKAEEAAKKVFYHESGGRLSIRAAGSYRARLKELKTRERQFGKKPQKTAQDIQEFRDFAKGKLEELSMLRAKIEARLDKLRSTVTKKRASIKKMQDEIPQKQALKQRHQANLANAEQKISSLKANPYATGSALARIKKGRGNTTKGKWGEDLTDNWLKETGLFDDMVETYGALPIKMAGLDNWDKIGKALELFGMNTGDLARRMATSLKKTATGRLNRKVTIGLETEITVEIKYHLDRILRRAPTKKKPSVLVQKGVLIKGDDLFEAAQSTVFHWKKHGVPYRVTKSIGPDKILRNRKTGQPAIIEVKTGPGAQLAEGQMTTRGINRWIELMKNSGGKLYRPKIANQLQQALGTGNLERYLVRVTNEGKPSITRLVQQGNKLIELPIKLSP
ncbi:MAG: hypothetical protein V3W19_10950, partial [Desulfatiglandales bacterium]